MGEMTTETPIMVRAKITRAEWDAIRKLAIDLNMSTSELVGRMLRDGLNLRSVVVA